MTDEFDDASPGWKMTSFFGDYTLSTSREPIGKTQQQLTVIHVHDNQMEEKHRLIMGPEDLRTLIRRLRHEYRQIAAHQCSTT